MTVKVEAPTDHYTDAPPLHPNLLVGSLHLLFWIIFHPSAWRHHVARIAPGLTADFTLPDLRRNQWHNPALRRLLIQLYLVWPLLCFLLFIPVFRFGRVSPQDFVATLLHFTMIVLVMNLLFGTVVSVASGVVAGVAVGVTVGLAGSLISNFFAREITINVAIGGFIGVAAGLNGRFTPKKQIHSPTRQIGAIVVGVLIGGLISLVRYLLEMLGQSTGLPGNIAYVLARSLMVGLSFGMGIGWQYGRRAGLWAGIGTALLYGITNLITNSTLPDPLRGLNSGVLFSVSLIGSFVLPFVLARQIAGVWAGAWAGTLASYGRHIAFGSVFESSSIIWLNTLSGFGGAVLGLTISWWRPLLFYPLVAAWNLLLYRADQQRPAGASSLLHLHAAFWDEDQFLRLHGLDEHLLLVLERNPAAGEAAMAYLATGPQRWAVQAAQIELDARRLARCAGVMAIRDIHRSLSPGALSDSRVVRLLGHFSHVSRDVDAALNQTTAYNQRQALNAVLERLDNLLRELTRSSNPYAVRFHPIATRWRHILADRVQELALVAEALQEIDSPYVIGIPLVAQHQVFVGRTDVSADIGRLVQRPHSPPLFLYGQRRMGKTSLLNNLGRLLPTTILPLFVDLQGPASWATDHAGFLYSVAQSMIASAARQRANTLPALSREALAADPFVRFDQWLDSVEEVLAAASLTSVLLALDEFEALDDALDDGRFDERAIFSLLRHLIQHRPRFKLLMAGSHTPAEFERWASYLINARLIHLTYLNETETRRLIERPIEDFSLQYRPQASHRVIDLTRGHPFLVQLLCNEIVSLKNKQDPSQRRLASVDDVEAAVGHALDHGSLYFADIYRNRIDETALQILSLLAAQGEGVPLSHSALATQLAPCHDLDEALDLLLRRELVEIANGGYRFQVELIRRWFARSRHSATAATNR